MSTAAFFQQIAEVKITELFYGKPEDIEDWMSLVGEISKSFPGLETQEALAEHRKTVLEFMSRKEALCIKQEGKIIGVLLFSKEFDMICCLGVSPAQRRNGAASALMEKALLLLDGTREITVSTYREGEEKGAAARSFYKKFGFCEGELVEEFGYPSQVFALKP